MSGRKTTRRTKKVPPELKTTGFGAAMLEAMRRSPSDVDVVSDVEFARRRVAPAKSSEMGRPLSELLWCIPPDMHEKARKHIAALESEVRADEREACARVVDLIPAVGKSDLRRIATAIRNRE